jgi:hypothetical protein
MRDDHDLEARTGRTVSAKIAALEKIVVDIIANKIV